MTDFFSQGAFTPFDAIVVVLVLFSGLMAFARGFVREVTSVAAFVFALLAAYLSWIWFSQEVRDMLPAGWALWIGDLTVAVVVFILIYAVSAWIGVRLSKLLHTSSEIGLLDRLAGLAFGVARGLAVIVAIILAAGPFIEEAQINWIVEARTYPYFVTWADWVSANVPAFAETVQDTLPEAEARSR